MKRCILAVLLILLAVSAFGQTTRWFQGSFEEALEQRFHIGGGPSVAVVNADGSLIDILTDFNSPDTYLERLKKALKGIDTYASLKAEYDRNPRDLKLMYVMADKHFRMWQNDSSVAYCSKILERGPKRPKPLTYSFRGSTSICTKSPDSAWPAPSGIPNSLPEAWRNSKLNFPNPD